MAAIHGHSSLSAGSPPTTFLSNLNCLPHPVNINAPLIIGGLNNQNDDSKISKETRFHLVPPLAGGLPGRADIEGGLRFVVVAIAIGLFVVIAIGTEVSPEQHTPMNLEHKFQKSSLEH
jgi:hypothetical protein